MIVGKKNLLYQKSLFEIRYADDTQLTLRRICVGKNPVIEISG